MKDKLDGMNAQFREGYVVGTSIANNCLGSNGGNNLSESCEIASRSHKVNQSADFIAGMDSGISAVVNEASRRMNGPREGMRKVYRRW